MASCDLVRMNMAGVTTGAGKSALARGRARVDPSGMNIPETWYAKSGDVHIAYRVWGEGPYDLVVVPPLL
jgi:hypothetical protein